MKSFQSLTATLALAISFAACNNSPSTDSAAKADSTAAVSTVNASEENNQKLEISNVSLKGGATSSFKMNVNGTSGPEVKNIEVEANDSIYVFVSVSLNPNNAQLPFPESR